MNEHVHPTFRAILAGFDPTAMADRFKEAEKPKTDDILAYKVNKIIAHATVYPYDQQHTYERTVVSAVTMIAMNVCDYYKRQGKWAMYWDDEEREREFHKYLADKVEYLEGYANDAMGTLPKSGADV
jgi:hypothetical protein